MSAIASGVTLPTAMSLATRAEGLAPETGGHAKIAIPRGHDFTALVTLATCNCLMELASDGSVTPELAQSATPEDGGACWIFDLRRDVVFHDGTKLEASHVVESLGASGFTDLAAVRELVATGPHQVSVSLHRANLDFPRLLTSPNFAIQRTSEAGHVVGTGGYRYVPDTPVERSLHLVRAEGYWKPNRAHLAEVTLYQRETAAQLHTDIISGVVDFAASISPETTAFLSGLPHLQVMRFEATRALTIAPTDARNSDSLATIAALKSTIDREQFVRKALLGNGTPGNDSLTCSKTLSAGSVSGPNTAVGQTDLITDETQAWAAHLAKMAERAGIALHLSDTRTGNASIEATSIAAEEIDAHLSTPNQQRRCFSAPRDADLYIEEIEAALAIENSHDRKTALERAHSFLQARGTLFVPAWQHDIAAYSTRLRCPARLTPQRPNDGHRLIERWWIASSES